MVKLEKTGRGFALSKFQDFYGSQCSIQDSSLAVCEDDPPGSWCIWLGVDVDFKGRECPARMHLTQNQVHELLPLLKRFVATGSIAE